MVAFKRSAFDMEAIFEFLYLATPIPSTSELCSLGHPTLESEEDSGSLIKVFMPAKSTNRSGVLIPTGFVIDIPPFLKEDNATSLFCINSIGLTEEERS